MYHTSPKLRVLKNGNLRTNHDVEVKAQKGLRKRKCHSVYQNTFVTTIVKYTLRTPSSPQDSQTIHDLNPSGDYDNTDERSTRIERAAEVERGDHPRDGTQDSQTKRI
jgi:hypothetical protein